uniref:Uncharacterized protein n=1 Tax=Avena sativa TaxID=4498 RepID=A0ACD5WUW0_AVESA
MVAISRDRSEARVQLRSGSNGKRDVRSGDGARETRDGLAGLSPLNWGFPLLRAPTPSAMEEEEGARHGGGPELSAAGGADLISALPDDLLLQVLVRLRCAATAARTSLLSRRWRGLWTRLPDLTFRDLALDPLLHALASLQAPLVVGPGVPLLNICVPAAALDKFDLEGRVSSLLHATARLSPVELRFAVPPMIIPVKVLHFHRATSVELHGLHLAFADSPSRFPRAASTGLLSSSNWRYPSPPGAGSQSVCPFWHHCWRRSPGDETRSGETACLQLPRVHVLSLYSLAHISHCFPEAEAELTTEIEKHMVVHFSALELHFVTRGHAFGAFALQILSMRRICTATRNLKIVLSRPEDKEACPVNCHCHERKNWRNQSISLTNLEMVEIKGFQGDDHEFDFMTLIFTCAPMLKRMTVRLSDAVATSNGWCTKVYDIFKAYPFVECDLHLSPGSTHSCHSGVST